MFSFSLCFSKIIKGPVLPDNNPFYEEEKSLIMLTYFKFIHLILVMITITATYLESITADNPWSMEVQFHSPMVMLVFLGVTVTDTFFTISAMLAFYKVSKIYEELDRSFTLTNILQLYLKRFLRFVPLVYLTFFFGVYVMPHLHGGEDDVDGNSIWYTFKEILFYRCTQPDIMASKLLMYSNFYPSFQDDKNDCMAWSWTYEQDMQLFLFTPFFVMLYFKIGRYALYVFLLLLIGLGIFINYRVALSKNLTAGVFSLENYYMYSYYLIKPWCKISVYCFGLMCGMFFRDLRNY